MATISCSNRHADGFSFIEILSAMVVIAILAGMLFAGARSLRQSTARKSAFQQEQSLIQALKQYRGTYQKWPGQTQDASDLTASNCASMILDLTNNVRGINFTGSLKIENDAFIDPWGRPYTLCLDENGDGTSEWNQTSFPCPAATNMAEPVLVISLGPDPEDEDKRVYSWTLK